MSFGALVPDRRALIASLVIAVGLVGSLLLARWLRLRWLKERP